MRVMSHCEIVDWPTKARRYCTYWAVYTDGLRVLRYSDSGPVLSAGEIRAGQAEVKAHRRAWK